MRDLISSTSGRRKTLITASGLPPLAVSSRTLATPNMRWSGFCSRSTFWNRW